MLSRLETMVLMGMDLPLPAIQRQIASGLDITTDCVVLAVIAVVFAGLLLVGFRKRAKKEQESEVEVSEKAVSGTPVQA